MRTCAVCGRVDYPNKGTRCNSCLSNHKRHKRKQELVTLFGGKCQRCGYDKSYQALDFHHLIETDKQFSISGNHCRKWATVVEEARKCILLCANCHREEHAGL